ncbi:MAG: 6-pyruvoyl tetrahydropterin synthase [Gammaproteobacteria bacterium]|nr:6-pyruvoyl tetrahydropterin synthase [Gammaproteobacteria bacterium]
MRYCRIEVAKQAYNFSIAHFTIFSATSREDLHGHNFQVECELEAPVGDDGLMFDYAIIKRTLKELCDAIDEKTILPERSPHLTLGARDGYLSAEFDGETLLFLARDVMTLPVANTTVEEFSNYFLDKIVSHPALEGRGVREVLVKVSSSPGQRGVSCWKDPNRHPNQKGENA